MKMNETNTRTRLSELHTVAIPVTNQDRALEFFLDKLGFEKRMDVPFGGGQRWVEVAPPGAVTTIALVRAGDGMPTGIDTGIRLTSEDAEADHADLLARGVDADPEVIRMGGVPAMFALRDPDGNRLVIVGRR
jgi:catechol 2,3-dioxygenase-like lactoylglutathione lyase family enzyme